MLQLKGCQINYDKTIILDKVDISFPPGQLNIIIGPNGCGKTTLLKAITGIIPLKQGNITNTFTKKVFIPQQYVYPEGLTLYEYLSCILYQDHYSFSLATKDKKQIHKTLKLLGLSDKKESLIHQISSGERQLLHLGLSLLSGADLILLDEPTANLDMKNQINIMQMIKKLSHKEITFIIILHDLNLAAKYGDHFFLINNDGSIQSGHKAEIINETVLSQTYDVQFKVIEVDEETFIYPLYQ